MAENDPKDLFPFDEMSTGEASSLIRRAHQITGQPDQPVPANQRPAEPLKPMTGAQLAFRPSAPPRTPGGTGTAPALKPTTGNNPAVKPATGAHAAFRPSAPPAPKPSTGVQPAFTPNEPPRRPGTASHTAYRPQPPAPEPEPAEAAPPEEAPVFDLERLQAQIRSLSITDSALGRTPGKVKPSKLPSSAAEDTFVKSKMKQAEEKVPDFSLDDDLG